LSAILIRERGGGGEEEGGVLVGHPGLRSKKMSGRRGGGKRLLGRKVNKERGREKVGETWIGEKAI
jgi:hypothetical protein